MNPDRTPATSDRAPVTPDPTGIRDSLSLLFSDGDVVELRALGDVGVHSGYFTDFDLLAEKAGAMDAFRDVHGIYVTLNEVNPALLSRRANRVKQRLSRSDATTADTDICRRRWLPVDLDPVRPSGVSANEAEHLAALKRAETIDEWLAGKGFPAPVLADSGNGAHLLYRIDLPNDNDATQLIKACLAVLDTFFSDEVVHCDTANFNAGRIWKLYGTTARKGDHTAERPHRQAQIITAPDEPQVVPDATLRGLAALLPCSAPAEDQPRRRGSFDLGHWLNTKGIAVRSEKPWHGGTLFVLAECPFSSAHKDGAFAIQFANGALFAGCHHASCGGGSQRWQELKTRFEPERAAGRPKNRTNGAAPSPHEKKPPQTSSPVEPDTPPDTQEDRKKAIEILEDGDPLRFILDCFHREHIGDQTVAECLIMSVASQSVENTSGLHVAISGNSGKGKSHACSTMIQLLPEDYRLTGTVSNKALFYHDSLQPGTVLLFDDISLSEEMREILKSATASFRESIQHRTLTRERQLKLCTIPERCVWWLAKVESVGDDQVMNRMLTVWIDDSVQQDQKVVGHMKLADAKRHGERQTDTGIGVCREIWRIIKQQIVYVLIPFSPRICFRTTANRRNPAMLLDLIKCHALLHCCQRERDDEGSIIASHEDYIYARRLYLSINGNFGGQETKQTRNEAAALETIWKMGLEIFTVRQLQQALGLSYQPTYRLLHGYNNNKATYTGILDKCPAVSLIDATVAEEICGIALKRRDHYFFFDREVYREWMEKADVWIGDSDYEEEDYSDPDDFTPSPGLHPRSETDGPSKKNRIDNHSSKELQYRDICTDRERLFHEGGASFTRADTGGGRDLSIYDSGMSEDESQDGERTPPLTSIGKNRDISGYPHKSKPKKTGEEVKINRGEGHTPPLPGILDHRDFRRSRVSLGHCTLCNEGPAVYHSREQRASVCETCYARLVREANRGEGVG